MTDEELSGKAKGGAARAAKLSSDERKKIAKKAAEARWGKKDMAIAACEGELSIGDASISCYVLDDGQRILSTRGIMKSLGRTWRGRKYSGTDMPVFMEANNLKPFIPDNLDLVPKRLKTPSGVIAEGFSAEVLPSVCDIYLAAREAGALTAAQYSVATKCEILIRAFAKTGIIALVDEATGYQGFRPDDALSAYLEKVLNNELATWAKKFPDEFYKNIYLLKGWPWPGMKKNRFSVVAHYTRDLVYERLGPGVLKELEERTPVSESGYRRNKLHQWLSDDFGNPMLAQHLHSIVTLQRLALANGHGWAKFLKMVDQVMPKKGTTLELPLDDTTF